MHVEYSMYAAAMKLKKGKTYLIYEIPITVNRIFQIIKCD